MLSVCIPYRCVLYCTVSTTCGYQQCRGEIVVLNQFSATPQGLSAVLSVTSFENTSLFPNCALCRVPCAVCFPLGRIPFARLRQSSTTRRTLKRRRTAWTSPSKACSSASKRSARGEPGNLGMDPPAHCTELRWKDGSFVGSFFGLIQKLSAWDAATTVLPVVSCAVHRSSCFASGKKSFSPAFMLQYRA